MPPPRFTQDALPLLQSEQPPVAWRREADGILWLDFGDAAFGTLVIAKAAGPVRLRVHLGEQLDAAGRVERQPAGSIRYRCIEQELCAEGGDLRLVIPPDARNTGPGAVRMPPEIGEVFPFRYAEIEQADGFNPQQIRQIRVHVPFDHRASDFTSSDPVLNVVWTLCKHSIFATSFCGVYVDGDRERIPYEGDAFLNQVAHYGVDADYRMARRSLEYLIQFPTWPTEWQLHTVMMAWEDYLYTGDPRSLELFYQDLDRKTLRALAREDDLISTKSEHCTPEFERSLHLHGERYIFNHGLRDLVDWPPGSFTDGGTGETDLHDMRPVNTVVNAFHLHSLRLMARIACALGREEDATEFTAAFARAAESFQRVFFDANRGVYRDGEGSTHASLHSNMFPLAFDLVPAARKASVIAFVKSRGMACSVYGSHYLLEALLANDEEDAAFSLLCAQHDRSWWNMIRAGSTITWEAWDLKYKKNLDWNHAWGAAPAGILPRWVLGVRPRDPGFDRAWIQPRIGPLTHAAGRAPTRHGGIGVEVRVNANGGREINLDIPDGVRSSCLVLGKSAGKPRRVLHNGREVDCPVENGTDVIEGLGPGRHQVRC